MYMPSCSFGNWRGCLKWGFPVAVIYMFKVLVNFKELVAANLYLVVDFETIVSF